MRLRTDVDDLRVDYPQKSGWKTPLEHDAALAHALTMALTESPYMSDMLVTIKVRRRAAEIMADWGYSDDGYSADMRIADIGGLPDGRR